MNTIKFKSKTEEQLYRDAWDKYLASRQTIESKVTGNVQRKLEALRRVSSQHDNWNTVIFPFQVGSIGTSLHQSLGRVSRLSQLKHNNKMKKPKKLTPLQQAKAETLDTQELLKRLESMYDNLLVKLNKTNAQLDIEQAKVQALSAILQSIHTSAQAGADILRVKS